jgi:hypothetical protein
MFDDALKVKVVVESVKAMDLAELLAEFLESKSAST